MKYAIISDIFSNIYALEAVLKEIEKIAPDQIVCLGNIVGYGPNPRECILRIQELKCPCVIGMFDYFATDKRLCKHFGYRARVCVEWMCDQLKRNEKEFMKSLPHTLEFPEFIAVSNGPKDPQMNAYVNNIQDAKIHLYVLEKPLCFYGHIHTPLAFFLHSDGEVSRQNNFSEIHINPQIKTMISVGSVGSPRDNNPSASFGIYDSNKNKLSIHRVEYDIESVVQQILKIGFPEYIGERLRYGR
jgi:diadenosine tetraphosphatase ApaH/serine/threonine PP2A family protein phosphatase